MVDVLPEHHVYPLAHAEGTGRHETVALHLIEGRLWAAGVHHQLPVEWETWQEDLSWGDARGGGTQYSISTLID